MVIYLFIYYNQELKAIGYYCTSKLQSSTIYVNGVSDFNLEPENSFIDYDSYVLLLFDFTNCMISSNEMASSHNVELEAAKFLHKLIQDSKDEPAKLATKLYVVSIVFSR